MKNENAALRDKRHDYAAAGGLPAKSNPTNKALSGHVPADEDASPPPFQYAVKDYEVAAEQTVALICRLLERLAPVIGPDCPTVSDADKEGVRKEQSPLVEMFAEYTRRQRQMAAKLEDVLARLEI